MDKKGASDEAVLTLVVDKSPGDAAFRAVEISDWPLWLTVPMVAKRLSLGKTKVYELIDLADLPVVRVGRAIRVPTARFLKWVEEFEKQRLSA